MAACRQLGFDETGNSAIRSADHENPTKHEVYSVSQKNPPMRFSEIFSQTVGNF